SFFFGVLGPIAVGLVLWWIRVEWREREHNRKVLQQMYDELVQAQQQLSFLHAQRGDLLDRLMTLQEEERRRLAQEIHDELGQLLTGLSLHLKLCRDALPNDFQAAHAYLDRANALIRQTLDQAHALVMALRPIVLDDYGLVPALKEELQQRLAPLGIETDLQIEGDLDPLPDEVATAVFRIVQEAITNIIRHAQARHVRLWLRRTVDELSLVVEDDGVGLPAGGLPHRGDHKALGILGMQERARALGGRLNVTSRHPHGTQVALWLPLRQEERQR
ncbi:MAG: sensor histidine kinase, partial [Chloroflexi bacterium]